MGWLIFFNCPFIYLVNRFFKYKIVTLKYISRVTMCCCVSQHNGFIVWAWTNISLYCWCLMKSLIRWCMSSYITWYSISVMLCLNNCFVDNHVIPCYESYYGKSQIYFIFDNIISMTHSMFFSFYDTMLWAILW